jgi:hydroxypyruvate isomerase
MTDAPSPPLRFAANLSWLYTDLPFLDRFDAAARDGFAGVECLFPHEHPRAEVAARLNDTGLQLVLFNAAPGDWAAGERGLAALAGREADFRASVLNALDLAAALACPRVHVMAGLCAPAERPAALQRYTERLAWAAGQAQAAGCTLMIEPINPRDMPGYVLNRQAQAHALLDAVQAPNLKVQIGDSRSLMCHNASTTHYSVSAEAREEMGVTEGMLRLNVGLEDPDDLIGDLDQALRKIGL